jgi:hypothetical protein
MNGEEITRRLKYTLVCTAWLNAIHLGAMASVPGNIHEQFAISLRTHTGTDNHDFHPFYPGG